MGRKTTTLVNHPFVDLLFSNHLGCGEHSDWDTILANVLSTVLRSHSHETLTHLERPEVFLTCCWLILLLLVLSAYALPTDWCFTSVTCFFILFPPYYPLDLRNSEWTVRGYVTNGWGYGVILISCDWFLHLFPPFSGRWGKFDGVLFRRVAVTKRLNIWKWDNIVHYSHVGEKYASLPLPIFQELWRTRCGYRVDCCLLWSITQ